jgi:hypothetical protein
MGVRAQAKTETLATLVMFMSYLLFLGTIIQLFQQEFKKKIEKAPGLK